MKKKIEIRDVLTAEQLERFSQLMRNAADLDMWQTKIENAIPVSIEREAKVEAFVKMRISLTSATDEVVVKINKIFDELSSVLEKYNTALGTFLAVSRTFNDGTFERIDSIVAAPEKFEALILLSEKEFETMQKLREEITAYNVAAEDTLQRAEKIIRAQVN